MNNVTKNNKFSKLISEWYLVNGRDHLPWRKQVTPYRIWISEIMLQQTQVQTVVPFFKRFISKYPNLKSLSVASEDEILALWTGLGFYRRAKNIFKTKEIIKHDYKNIFPKKVPDPVPEKAPDPVPENVPTPTNPYSFNYTSVDPKHE